MNATLALLSGLGATEFLRRADFEECGPVNLRSLVHFSCRYDQQRLAGYQWLSGKLCAESRSDRSGFRESETQR
jgi:hypothetical protein